MALTVIVPKPSAGGEGGRALPQHLPQLPVSPHLVCVVIYQKNLEKFRLDGRLPLNEARHTPRGFLPGIFFMCWQREGNPHLL